MTAVTPRLPLPAAPSGPGVHPAWLPVDAFRPLGSRRVQIAGTGLLVDTVAAEVERACRQHGGSWLRAAAGNEPDVGGPAADVVLTLTDRAPDLGPEGYLVRGAGRTTRVEAAAPAGLLYGLFHLVRRGEAAFRPVGEERHLPATALRMVDHWDNVDVHPVHGQVERGYAGGSLFWAAGRLRTDLTRVTAYARLLAACGVNAVAVNNVNVDAAAARLLTDRLDDVVTLAGLLRPYGVRTHLAVSFAAPVLLAGLPTADPLDDAVRAWWRDAADRVHDRIPDFGGFVVKADSEGQPGPFADGRTHADGANLLAEVLEPYGGVVHWRAFVYDHRQDWRDRTTDRANAAYDTFVPLDGAFRPTVILQVKHGPIDFQPREPVSPLIGAMPATRLAVELQATQEYTGQQRHVCYLAPMWSDVLRFRFTSDPASAVGRIVRDGGLVAVSNVGDDPFWTGHPLAQANLYAVGRLGWDPDADPLDLLDEWIALTFPAAGPAARLVLHATMDRSWLRYESYTAPLGVGFMVRPGDHYGPAVDGYEYSPWGTYHLADRDGVGVDRSVATGTGFAGRYPGDRALAYESPGTCPDELLLFFHHVRYDHRLRKGSTVVQHIYDAHFAGAREVEDLLPLWETPQVADAVGPDVLARVRERLAEQACSAREWRDQVNSYFFRKSGVPDALGRPIY